MGIISKKAFYHLLWDNRSFVLAK